MYQILMFVLMRQDTQILLNFYCNEHMHSDDGTCCAGVDHVTSAPRNDDLLTPSSNKPLAAQQTVAAAFAVLRQWKTHFAF